MSQTLQAPPQAGMQPPAPAPAAPGASMGPTGPAPGAPQPQINPAFAAWMQANQQRQAVIAENQRRQAQFDAACALIRQDGVRGFKLDIEADSTIAPDEQQEKQSRIEFLQQMVPFMEQIVPIAQGNPEMATLMSEIAMFAVRGFRVARPLEEAFEKAFQVLGTMPKPPPKGMGKQTDPAIEQAKIQADVHDTQVRAATDQADTQSKERIALATLGQKTQETNQQMAMEQMRFQAEQAKSAVQAGMEMEKMHSTERLHNARLANTEAKGAGGLA